jgi:hypothetical protein
MTNKLDAEVQKMIVKQISTALKEMGLYTIQAASLVHATATATAASYTTQLNQQEILEFS